MPPVFHRKHEVPCVPGGWIVYFWFYQDLLVILVIEINLATIRFKTLPLVVTIIVNPKILKSVLYIYIINFNNQVR